ncbi:MAG: hypothetical protein M1816_004562 [Peltula sp. TS41687]|nr:MAG: hypothetical protein M1816_004562 [Peltula sp. TS41687]
MPVPPAHTAAQGHEAGRREPRHTRLGPLTECSERLDRRGLDQRRVEESGGGRNGVGLEPIVKEDPGGETGVLDRTDAPRCFAAAVGACRLAREELAIGLRGAGLGGSGRDGYEELRRSRSGRWPELFAGGAKLSRVALGRSRISSTDGSEAPALSTDCASSSVCDMCSGSSRHHRLLVRLRSPLARFYVVEHRAGLTCLRPKQPSPGHLVLFLFLASKPRLPILRQDLLYALLELGSSSHDTHLRFREAFRPSSRVSPFDKPGVGSSAVPGRYRRRYAA